MNPRLLDTAMPAWSDLDRAPGARGPLPARLAAVARGRVLVAGPHTLVDTLPPGDVTVLVRGVRDAEALSGLYAQRLDVAVCSGGPESLAGEPPFDTVVALGDLTGLVSAEGRDLTWGETFEALLSVLRDGGRLLLGVENPLGLHRLTARRGDTGDADWVISGDHDASRPAGRDRLRTRLIAAGLHVIREYAAFPEIAAPSVLLGPALVGDEGARGYLDATLSRAFPVGGGDLLADPRLLAGRALRTGAAQALAPGWVVVARKGAPELSPLPEGLVADGDDCIEIRPDGEGGWLRVPAGGGVQEAVPRGRTLQELIMAASLRRDLPAVRELLGAWQDGAAAGVPADQVVAGPTGLTPLRPAGEPVAALRDLAAALLHSGESLPWPGPLSVRQLTLMLAAMTGRDLDPEAIEADGPPLPVAVRELTAERDRLARELADARAKALWYEEMLTRRDTELARARKLIDLLSRKGPARLGTAFVAGVQVARGSARTILRKLRRS